VKSGMKRKGKRQAEYSELNKHTHGHVRPGRTGQLASDETANSSMTRKSKANRQRKDEFVDSVPPSAYSAIDNSLKRLDIPNKLRNTASPSTTNLSTVMNSSSKYLCRC
jgi:hypothetical protein